jgi:hypothetical protein
MTLAGGETIGWAVGWEYGDERGRQKIGKNPRQPVMTIIASMGGGFVRGAERSVDVEKTQIPYLPGYQAFVFGWREKK